MPLTPLLAPSHEALEAADLALVASGTATLETALFKTPMVIAYRQAQLTWRLMRSMVYLPYVGMPNILAGWELVSEYLRLLKDIQRVLPVAAKPERQGQHPALVPLVEGFEGRWVSGLAGVHQVGIGRFQGRPTRRCRVGSG